MSSPLGLGYKPSLRADGTGVAPGRGLEPRLRGPRPRVLPIAPPRNGTGDQDRTGITCLEGGHSTIELHRHGVDDRAQTGNLDLGKVALSH